MRNIGAPYGLKVSSLRSDHSVVIDLNGNPLKTHLKTAFIPMPTKVVHQLVEDINELPINAELTESLVFCLLSTFSIEESPNFQLYLDTDLQWAFWEGVLGYYKKNEAFLQTQLGNPEGADKPNKKYYDPRVWLRKGEESFIKRLEQSFDDLNCINRNA